MAPKKTHLFLSQAGLFLFLTLLSIEGQSSPPFLLSQALDQAKHHSPNLQAATLEAQASIDQWDATKGFKFPKLTLDGNYKYIDQIPSLKIGPTSINFGTHSVYSVGPTLTYSLFDGGQLGHQLDAMDALQKSKLSEKNAVVGQIEKLTKLAYIKARLTQEELDWIEESSKLAHLQEGDIQKKFKAGSASKLEKLLSHKEVLSIELKKAQATLELNNAQTELSSIVFQDVKLNSLQSLDELLEQYRQKKYQDFLIFKNHPQLLSLESLAQAQAQNGQAIKSEHLPKIVVFAKSSLDYPNGPRDEKIWQNVVGANLSFSLFEGGRISSQAASKYSEFLSLQKKSEQLTLNFNKEIQKIHSNLESSEVQLTQAEQILGQSIEVAQLTEQTYKAGRGSLIDVQTAQNKVLDSKILLSKLRAQKLSWWAELEWLSFQSHF